MEKNTNFAPVIELSKHIEILLLDSDCVIVPGLGGFVAHHVDARYDDNDSMFVPPLRTVGFNPQLTMNDSLLAQSYIEAYDISYPEAVRRIEDEVNELRQQLSCEGYYELCGLGELSLNEDSHIVFEPCEAGILTPALYGLSSYELLPLSATAPQREPSSEGDSAADDMEPRPHDGAITIKMSWLRNVAAAAAAVAAFLLLATPATTVEPSDNHEALTKMEFISVPQKSSTKSLTFAVPATTDEPSAAQPHAEQAEPTDAIEPSATMDPAPVRTYSLVLASQVARRNAEAFVSKMRSQGYESTRINVHNSTRRVVYGSFATEGEAYRALNRLRQTADGFDQAWVLHIDEAETQQ